MTQSNAPDQIEVFLQGEGIREITLIRVPRGGTVLNIVELARAHGLSTPSDVQTLVMLEDTDEPLALDASLETGGIDHRSRVHMHRCSKVDVRVNFNADQKTESFPPSATVGRVKKWAVGKEGFDLHGVDATEHLLQVCNSNNRPDEDVHIGTLVHVPNCGVCFDLVAKQRVEG